MHSKIIMKCNHNETTYAYIVQTIQDQPDVNNDDDKITIGDYLENKYVRDAVKKNKKYIKCANNHLLHSYESTVRKSHFAHNPPNHNDVHEISNWHLEWTERCIRHNIKTEAPLKTDDILNIADALIHNMTLEFQHSEYTNKKIKKRTIDHKLHGYDIMWIIDCTDLTIELMGAGEIYMMKFIDNKWKYKSFIDDEIKYIYLHHDSRIFRISPTDVKSDMVYVNAYMEVDQFIMAIYNNNIIWNERQIPQCNLYIKQMGAGCGKTYDSVQLLNNDEKSLFGDKLTYIYLTKMKTVVQVIRDEIEYQAKNNKLNNTNLFDAVDNALIGKQYKCDFLKNGIDRTVIIGTIDSFMYRIGNLNHDESDYFTGIINSICKNEMRLPNSNVLQRGLF